MKPAAYHTPHNTAALAATATENSDEETRHLARAAHGGSGNVWDRFCKGAQCLAQAGPEPLRGHEGPGDEDPATSLRVPRP